MRAKGFCRAFHNPFHLVGLPQNSHGLVLLNCNMMSPSHTVTHHPPPYTQLTGTVSHMLGQATLDSSFQEEREQILESCQTSSDHFKAGLIGLSSGVFGGFTSIFTQPYRGAQEYGVGVSTVTAWQPCCKYF